MEKCTKSSTVINIILWVMLIGIAIAMVVLGAVYSNKRIYYPYYSGDRVTENVKFGADFYTDSYEATAAAANNIYGLLRLSECSIDASARIVRIIGLTILFAGLILLVVCMCKIAQTILTLIRLRKVSTAATSETPAE